MVILKQKGLDAGFELAATGIFVRPLALLRLDLILDRLQPEYESIIVKHPVMTALKPEGRFCGQLFGDRDSWIKFPNRTHHTRQQIEALLQPFEVEWLEEEDHPGVTAIGEAKHWHIFHIVARKRG
ncbi:hypothetical protein K9N68_13175 [Kovacikia minuta CCNUW1]|uniref:hypothetical protein n=1 Tax=Kovacikia minuta TaxID=2931930 RepID=UPI001CCAC585|nr:hypothetical protein K9N68_13175 [Kovacikia minuta CCNUW1]